MRKKDPNTYTLNLTPRRLMRANRLLYLLILVSMSILCFLYKGVCGSLLNLRCFLFSLRMSVLYRFLNLQENILCVKGLHIKNDIPKIAHDIRR